jgi:transposase
MFSAFAGSGHGDRRAYDKPPKREAGIMRYELSDGEWATIRPMLPNKARGVIAAPARLAYAVLALTDFFEGNSVADVTPQTCGRYVEKRGRSIGTARRELGVLRAAINHAHRHGKITRPVAVELPDRPEPRDRWLSRVEAARIIRNARTPQAALPSAFHSDRSLHWSAQRSDPFAPLAAGKLGGKENQF